MQFRYCLMVMLFTVTHQSHAAEWKSVGVDTQGNSHLIHMGLLQRSGDSVTFWKMVNFGTRDADGVLSSKSQWTVNCARREHTLRYVMHYDDTNNQGMLIWSGAPPKTTWKPVAPETVADESLRMVCR